MGCHPRGPKELDTIEATGCSVWMKAVGAWPERRKLPLVLPSGAPGPWGVNPGQGSRAGASGSGRGSVHHAAPFSFCGSGGSFLHQALVGCGLIRNFLKEPSCPPQPAPHLPR